MPLDHPAIDHAVVNSDFHGSRVCVVSRLEADAVIEGFRFLFPHDTILTTGIGGDVCIYTHNAPASLVAERISQHLRGAKRAA